MRRNGIDKRLGDCLPHNLLFSIEMFRSLDYTGPLPSSMSMESCKSEAKELLFAI